MSPGLVAVLCGALVLLRALVDVHSPSVVDAHAALAAVGLLAVVPAAAAARRVALLLVGAALVALPLSWDPWVSVMALPTLVAPLALLCLASGAGAMGRTAVLGGVVAVGVVNAVTGAWQRVVTYPSLLARAGELGASQAEIDTLAAARPLGVAVSPDLAGGLSLAAVFCALALAAELAASADPRAQRARQLVLGAAGVAMIGVLLSRSVGCALALVVGLAASALPRLGPLRAAIIGALGALPALGFLALRGTAEAGASVTDRLANWQAALAAFVEAPLSGVGFMRFAPAYALVREPGSNVTRYAHAAWAQWLAETGVIGAIAAVAAIVVVVRALRVLPSSPGTAFVIAALCALGSRALFDYDLQVGQNAMVFAAVIGVAIAPTEPPTLAPRQRITAVVGAVLATLLVIVMAVRASALDRNALVLEDARGWADALPFDVDAQLAATRAGLDRLAACTGDGCAALAQEAEARLDRLCARRHPPGAAFVLRARLKAERDDLRGALADVDRALAVDRGSESAHRLGLALVDELDEDPAPRLESARAWGIAPPPAAPAVTPPAPPAL